MARNKGRGAARSINNYSTTSRASGKGGNQMTGQMGNKATMPKDMPGNGVAAKGSMKAK